MYDHLCYETLPCLKMQTPFLEALRPLNGQIKSLVMLPIHPAKSHPVNIMTGALNCSQGEFMSSRCYRASFARPLMDPHPGNSRPRSESAVQRTRPF